MMHREEKKKPGAVGLRMLRGIVDEEKPHQVARIPHKRDLLPGA